MSTVHTLWIQTDRLLPDKLHKAHAGRIGERGIPWKQGSLWVADGTDSVADLEQWAQVCLQQHGQPGALNEHVIQQFTMRTIAINTTNLPGIRDLLQQSMTWPNEQTISRELTYSVGPWEQDNRDSVLEQGPPSTGMLPEQGLHSKNANSSFWTKGHRQRIINYTRSHTRKVPGLLLSSMLELRELPTQ